MLDLELSVNGQKIKAQVPAGITLLDFLRGQLGLTGAKNGCAKGHCGACTVIMDGKATRACLVKIEKANGSRIETIEGLAQGDTLHHLQRAFIEHNAIQCGFCTPGMIMSARALLDRNLTPSADEIKSHLTRSRNLCRCTGYVNIIKAIQAAGKAIAAGEQPGALPDQGSQARYMTAKDELLEMATGRRRYGDDIKMQGMLFGKVLFSEHPHAKIIHIDTCAALAVPGVVRVITASDIPGKNVAGYMIRDAVAIAGEKVRSTGDSVASVFAETLEAAEEAVKEIKVTYEPLPAVFSPAQSSLPGAPQIHEKGNQLAHYVLARGDLESAFKKCAVVIEDDYTTPFVDQGYIEPDVGIGFPDEAGGITIWIATQTAFDDRDQLAGILDLPPEKVRVVQIPCGGAFGGRLDIIIHQHLALGAYFTQRPVKITLTREESFRSRSKRHAVNIHYKTGAAQDGHILALDAHFVADTGAYTSAGLSVLKAMMAVGAGPYYVPNLRIEGESWYTNNITAGAMRGFGTNQAAFALEQQVDRMARALKTDPFEFRLINGLEAGMLTATNHQLEPGVVSIKETIRAARQALGQLDLPQSNGSKKIGIGVACGVKSVGFGSGVVEAGGIIVELDQDGRMTIHSSHHDMGQGVKAGLATIAATEMGIPVDAIQVTGPDTAVTPPSGPTNAQRHFFLSGNALISACRKIKNELFSRAADALDTDPSSLKIEGSRVVDTPSGKSLAIGAVHTRFRIDESFQPPKTTSTLYKEEGVPNPEEWEPRRTHYCYSHNTQVAVVEVDEETGETKVHTMISSQDAGKIINRHVLEGQTYGGVMQGLGYALYEEFEIENGIMHTSTLLKSGVPTADKSPHIVPVILEIPHPEGPLGAKGFSEGTIMAAAPAIINAIYDAVGVRITSLPAKKQKVLAAIKEKV